jgi:hypothetical protein
MNNLLFSTTDQLYDKLGIFLKTIPDDVINQLVTTLNSNYLNTIKQKNKYLSNLTSIPHTIDGFVLKIPIYNNDFYSSCAIPGSLSTDFDHYANVIILNNEFIKKNKNCQNLSDISGIPDDFKQFLKFKDNDKYQMLLRFELNKSDNPLAFTEIMTINSNNNDYYCIVQCGLFKEQVTINIKYDIYEGISRTYDDKFILQNVNVDGIAPYLLYNKEDNVNINIYTLSSDQCLGLKNPYFQDPNNVGNFNTSFGIPNNSGGCSFPKYSDKIDIYPYLDALLYNNKYSFYFSDMNNLNPKNSKLWLPIQNEQNQFKFVQIVNNDSIYVYTNTTPKLSDLNNNNYYYNKNTGAASIEGDVINRYIRYGWNEKTPDDGKYYIKLKDDSYLDFKDFVNGYNNASIFINNGKYNFVKGYNNAITQNFFYPLLNCTPEQTDTTGNICNFMLPDNQIFAKSTGMTINNPTGTIGLDTSNILFNNTEWGNNQYVPTTIQNEKTKKDYLSVATNWYTTSEQTTTWPKFYSDFYTRLSDDNNNVDKFCQSLSNTSAIGSSIKSGNILPSLNDDQVINSLFKCSPTPGSTGQVGPSPKPPPEMWWQNCNPDLSSTTNCSGGYDLGNGYKNFMIKKDQQGGTGWYGIIDLSNNKQLEGTRSISDIYTNLNGGNDTFQNGNCSYHDKNILTQLTSLVQNQNNDTYQTDNTYKCLFRGTPDGIVDDSGNSKYNGYQSLSCGAGNGTNYDNGISGLINSPFTFMAPLSFKPDTTNTDYYGITNSWSNNIGNGKSFGNNDYPFYYSSNKDVSAPGSMNGLGLSITIKNTENVDLTINVYNNDGLKHSNVIIEPGNTQNITITPIINAPPEKICKISDSDTIFSNGILDKNFKESTNRCSNGLSNNNSLPSNWCLNIDDPFLDRSTADHYLPQFYFTLKWNDNDQNNYYIIYDLGLTSNVKNVNPFPSIQSCWFKEPDPSKWNITDSNSALLQQGGSDLYIYGTSDACRQTNNNNIRRFNFNINDSESLVYELNKSDLITNNRIKVSIPKNCYEYNTKSNPKIIDNIDPLNCNCNQRYNKDGTPMKDSSGNNIYGIDADHQCLPTGEPYTLFYALN